MERSLIDRINELAKKAKTVGLNEAEKAEQVKLRQEYLKLFRQNVETTLDTVVFVDKNGKETRIQKKNNTRLQ